MAMRLMAVMISGLMLGLAGCANYHLGTGSHVTFGTLYVAPVENGTNLPQAVALISTQLREAFLRDGRIQLVTSAADADATLSIKLTSYSREIATVLSNDTGRARGFDLTLAASASLHDNRSGKALFTDRPLSVRRQIFTDDPTTPGRFDDQLQAEYQTLPLLAESLASSATHAVLDTW